MPRLLANPAPPGACKVARLTARDYDLLPEGGPRYQLIDGNLYMAPSPGFDHQSTIVSLTLLLANHVNKHQLGTVLVAPMDVELDRHNVFQPDLMFISNSRRNIIHEKRIKGAPDLVIEILSPSTRKLDVTIKRLEYARAGVGEIWFVDRKGRKVTVHDFTDCGHPLVRVLVPADTLSTPLLPGLQIPLSPLLP